MFSLSQLFDVSESSIISARRQVCKATLEEVVPLHIGWPNREEMADIASTIDMTGQHHFPGVVGFLDGSHIPIAKPIINPDNYYNRKKFHSVILQAVCREDLRFTDIAVGCPGRMHDARALKNSSLWDTGHGKTMQSQFHILADAAYPLQRWLLTPFRNTGNLTPQQLHYNRALSSKRQNIERAFGLLKRRFSKMSLGIDIADLDEINEIIMATCALHNICIVMKDDADDLDNEVAIPPFQQPVNHLIPPNLGAEGQLKRINICNAL